MVRNLPVVRLLLAVLLAVMAGPLLADAGPPQGSGRPEQGRQDLGALGAMAAPPESWEGVSWRLAVSLVDAQAQLQEEPLFLPRAVVRRFGRGGVETPGVLRDRFNGWRILGVASFEHPSSTIASDLAMSLRRLRDREPNAAPEMLLRSLIPRPGEMQAAEQTATRWVSSAMNASPKDQLAIVMLWDPSRANRPVLERMSFVMLKAGRLPDGRYRVQLVCHGSAQEALLEGF